MATKDRDLVELITDETTAEQAPSSRKRQRRPEEKGLPDCEARLALAATFVQVQHRLWPEVAVLGLLPPNTEASQHELAQNFADRFVSDDVAFVRPDCVKPCWQSLGGCYLRYSDDNSNPRSLDQQLFNVLERAHRDKIFIPWEHVFADAAVTGTIASRRGYEAAKDLIQKQDSNVTHLFIDEIGRASRNAVEAMKLGRLVDEKHKRLIGISDGFDSQSPQSKLMLSIFATLQEWFIDQLRSKVNRGMRDAFEQGKNIQPPCLGYKLVPLLDADGEPMLDSDNKPLNQKIVDPQQARWVLKAFCLYAEKQSSPTKIGRFFNKHQVGGVQTWDGGRIRKLLRRRVYIGIEMYRMTRQTQDPETGKWNTVKRPRKDWLVRRSPHLRIVPRNLWRKARQRLLECSRAYSAKASSQQTRTSVYPTTLIRPMCGYCGKVLWLGRAGKYRSYCCINGRDGKHGCQLRTYKSVRIVETVLLDCLKETLLTHEFLEEVLTAANQFLVEEAQKPKEDTQPLKQEIQRVEKKRNKLKKILDKDGDTDFDTLVAQIRRWEQQLKELRDRLRTLEARNVAPPPQMIMADVEKLLEGLRDVLNQDVETAAPLLQELTGPIKVFQADEPDSKGTPWLAKFTINAVTVFAKLAASRDCPTTSTWEYLHTRGWTMPKTVELVLERIPKYEALAPEFVKLHEQGVSLSTIASAHNMSRAYAKDILEFGRTGKRPEWTCGQRAGECKDKVPKYQHISPEVCRLRDEAQMSWRKICAYLKQERNISASQSTIIRAYDYGHPEIVQASLDIGETPDRGKYSHLRGETYREIRRRLKEGETQPEIAAAVGCSVNTVQREMKRLKAAA